MDYDECKEEESRKGVKSKLPKRIQNLMKFIFDMNLIEKNMIKVGYDPKKLPLGKLSKDTIYKGFSTLKDIEKELQNKNSREKLSQLSSEFFRFIPHDFKYENVGKFVINTKEKLKDKLALVYSLKEIQIASEIARSLKSKDSLHSHDIKYNNLKWKIEPLSPKSKEYKTLSEAIDIDHSSTNSFKVTIQEIFKIWREGESEKFKSEIGNKTLLWHGSNFVNWGGILSQGLRIAPPEAPTWGFMFGKGVYFADVFHKSADYSWFLNSKNVGLIALWDVALGNTNDIIREDSSLSLSTLLKGTNSTKGCGKFIPSRTIEIDGSKLHLGPLKTNDENNELTHNEYICYDEDQIQLKYLFMWKFDI